MTQKNNHQPHQNQQTNDEPLALVGTRIGKCDICKTTKKILLLSYGFSLCQDCINISTLILEQLTLDETPPQSQPQKIAISGASTT